jgi:hypothetical protein
VVAVEDGEPPGHGGIERQVGGRVVTEGERVVAAAVGEEAAVALRPAGVPAVPRVTEGTAAERVGLGTGREMMGDDLGAVRHGVLL